MKNYLQFISLTWLTFLNYTALKIGKRNTNNPI